MFFTLKGYRKIKKKNQDELISAIDHHVGRYRLEGTILLRHIVLRYTFEYIEFRQNTVVTILLSSSIDRSLLGLQVRHQQADRVF